MVVAYSTNILLNILTALVCLRFLGLLGFSRNEAIAGVLTLLLCTTHLHYTQNMMENNYILLLTLTGFAFQYEWLRTGNQRALWIGSAALGLNLLTRRSLSSPHRTASWSSRRRSLAESHCLCENSHSDQCWVFRPGSLVPVLPLRLGVHHVHQRVRRTTETARPDPAGKISF
jgi:hypothetical protein